MEERGPVPGSQPSATSTMPSTETASDARWQQKLLPLMMSMLGLMTVVFALANGLEIYSLQRQIRDRHQVDMSAILNNSDLEIGANAQIGQHVPVAEKIEYLQWKVNAVLENDTIDRRYHQANSSSLTRAYIIFIGFTTGMVLALVGATFVLGKLREPASNVGLTGGVVKMSIASASPGLVLATLGTTLMLATIFARADVVVKDEPVYLRVPVAEESTAPRVHPASTVPAKPGAFAQASPEPGYSLSPAQPTVANTRAPSSGAMVGTASAGGSRSGIIPSSTPLPPPTPKSNPRILPGDGPY